MDNIEWAIRALAQLSGVQIQLFPDFVHVPDELVNALGDALESINYEIESADGFKKIRELDDYILSISGDACPEAWTQKGFLHGEEWKEIRRRATEIVSDMGWSLESPGINQCFVYGKFDDEDNVI